MDFQTVQKIIMAILAIGELLAGSDRNKSNSRKDDWF